MSAMLVALLAVLASAALLNVFATVRLFRSDGLDLGQQIAQCALIWLLPLVGSLFVLHLLAESGSRQRDASWLPQEQMNPQLEEALRSTVRGGAHAARNEAESSIAEHAHHAVGSAESPD